MKAPVSASDPYFWLMTGLFTAIALALRLYHLDFRGLWTDEFHTIDAVMKPAPELIHDRLEAGHLPLYFLGLRAWLILDPSLSAWSLRLFSVLFGILTIPALALLAAGRLTKPHFVALMTVATVNGTAIWASQEARPYSMVLLTATAAHLAFLHVVHHARLGAWLSYFGWLALSVAAHPIMVVFAVGHFAFSFLIRREHPVHARQARRIFLTIIAVVIPGTVWFAAVQEKFVEFSFSFPPPTRLLNRLATVALGASPSVVPGARDIAAVVLVIALIGVGMGRAQILKGTLHIHRQTRDLLRFSAVSVAVPCLLIYAFGFFFPHVIGPDRYFLPVAPLLWVLMVWGISRLWPAWRVGTAAAAAILLVGGAAGQLTDRGTGLREVAAFMRDRMQPEDYVLIRSSGTIELGLRYYGIEAEIRRVDDVRPESEVARRLADVIDGQRLWLVLYRDKERRLEKALVRRGDFEVQESFAVADAKALLLEVPPDADRRD